MNKNITIYKKWLPIIIVVIAIPLSYLIMESGKIDKSKRKPFNQSRKARIVNVTALTRADVIPLWQASGVVKASESVKITAEVSGIVSNINDMATPGALLNKGEWLVKLDPIDYQIALTTQQAQLVQAEANLALEQADQILAKEELSLIENIEESNLEMSLVLREPQLRSSQAKLDIAKANVKKAQVALRRTKVSMPFRGKITQRTTGRGSKVSQNSNLFEIVNVDQFWIEVKIPRSFLPLLDERSFATLSQKKLWGDGKIRQAKIVSVLPQLDTRDRQVKLLLSIDDPLLLTADAKSLEQPSVFINDFINVELKGQKISKAWTIKSNWLQTDNTIWVVDKGNKLQKRNIATLFKGKGVTYVNGEFQWGDRALTEKPGIATIGLPVLPKNPTKQSTNRVDPSDYIKDKKFNKDKRKKFKNAQDKKGSSRGEQG